MIFERIYWALLIGELSRQCGYNETDGNVWHRRARRQTTMMVDWMRCQPLSMREVTAAAAT